MLIRRIGYQRGAVVGLVVAAAGCCLFYPAATRSYGLFLLAFFVLAAGITTLQVAANPYVTVLGDPVTASSRLTLTQAFNSLGTAIAPALGGALILTADVRGAADVIRMPAAEQAAYRAEQAASVQGPYLMLAVALLALAILFALARLPSIAQARATVPATSGSLLAHRHLVLGAFGIFMYVGAEVSIGSFLINFLGEANIAALTPAAAAHYVGYYWGGAMLGRFVGFGAMRSISPGKVLACGAAGSVALIVAAIVSQGALAMWAIIAVGLCNSIMFPTIFSIALDKLGPQTGQGSGLLCMSIVGGAVVPFIQGYLADQVGLQISFLVPACCYVYIAYFGLKYAGIYSQPAHS
jgi:FHS family L-fucose permease-like MFS transporter